ncbi:CREB3 regulatory factor-like isoform X2 [Conger conger]|nr:CREB3 regulatory factor-like isoform X2 [Conger conger]
MPLPSISGMEPPFGDAFENYSFTEQALTSTDQALTSTDLLASSSDPDFMYELDRDVGCRQSPRGGVLLAGDCKELESMEHLAELQDSDPSCNAAFEQWDSYWEDLTRYTRLTSCDIWGTKEVDFLGLDDFSSPYQDEEVMGRTPTLAQLNGEDSQPVGEALYHPDLLLSQKPHAPLPPPSHGKKGPVRQATPGCSSARGAECARKATWPIATSTETMSKSQGLKVAPPPAADCKDYVRKASVRIGAQRRPVPEPAPPPPHTAAVSLAFTADATPAAQPPAAPASSPAPLSAGPAPSCVLTQREVESPKLEPPPPVPVSGLAAAPDPQVLPPGGGAEGGPDSSRDKEEEHNYSLFVTQGKMAAGEEPEPPEEVEEEEEEEEEEEGAEMEDEDHDEGFGSEHELSENEEEEEEEEEEDEEDEEEDEEEDYEDDKDDDMSDSFSEAGGDNDAGEEVKGLTAGSSRKRRKRRYFWEYSEQLTPSKQERLLKPCEWDRDTLPSNMYQRNGLHHGKHAVKKSRRTDVEDLTPNPRKLLQIGNELRKLNKVISDLTPVSELPLTARPRSRKEKNKLASRACRLKKKAQYEANKVKLWGLNTEYDRLLLVVNGIKEEIVNRVQVLSDDSGTSMAQKLEQLISETLVRSPVAGQTSDFVNQILENTAGGDPTGGLVGLRVPTSKV